LLSVGGVAVVAIIAAIAISASQRTPEAQVAAPTATPAVAEAEAAVGPAAQATAAAERDAQAQATAQANAATVQAQAVATTRRIYTSRVEQSLQRYANALGGVRDSNRQVAERPAVVADVLWRAQAATALQAMHGAAAEFTAAGPVPVDLTGVADLLQQVADETAQLSQAAIGGASAADGVNTIEVAAARTRIVRIAGLLKQANVDIRQGAAAAA
jgi:hypothetical protein